MYLPRRQRLFIQDALTNPEPPRRRIKRKSPALLAHMEKGEAKRRAEALDRAFAAVVTGRPLKPPSAGGPR